MEGCHCSLMEAQGLIYEQELVRDYFPAQRNSQPRLHKEFCLVILFSQKYWDTWLLHLQKVKIEENVELQQLISLVEFL